MPIVLGWLLTVYQAASPYAGEEQRALKALSSQEIQALEAGDGMGLAKAAELNRYPGPRHVLDLADALGLSDAQRASVQDSFDRMHAAALRLGAELVALEQELDDGFARATIDAVALARLTSEIGALQGRLRAVHLRAHLETRALLTPAQIDAYDRHRGYSAGGAHDHHPHD